MRIERLEEEERGGEGGRKDSRSLVVNATSANQHRPTLKSTLKLVTNQI